MYINKPQAPQNKIDVVTYHYDNLRDGVNSSETVLTPANVNPNAFGKLFSLAVDGDVYAQPLYISDLIMTDGSAHDVLFVATAHDSLYALDASSGQVLWKDSFIDPVHGITTVPDTDVSSDDITPEIGIIGTPVIDSATQTIYLVSKVKDSDASPVAYYQYLHAIDLVSGSEKFNGPTLVQGSVTDDAGTALSFDPLLGNQRAALILEQGAVYIAWASHGDNGDYHGWIMSYAAADISHQLAVLCATVNGSQAGIWMSGGGLSSDGTYLFAAVGNGTFDPLIQDYGDTALKLLPGNLAIADSFTPSDQQGLNDNDDDFGSAEPLLVTQPGTGLNDLITADKTGRVYIINRDHMGGFSGYSDGNTQEFDLAGSILNNMAYFAGHLYVGANNLPLEAFQLSNDEINPAPTSITAHIFGNGGDDGQGTNPVISDNGSVDGIVWVLDNSGYADRQPAVLLAYDTDDLTHELYNSGRQEDQDQPGPAVKFTAPLVVNGKVFVPGGSVVTVFGLR